MKVFRMWNRTKQRDIVRTSARIGDDSDETINNVAANVETFDQKTQLIIAQLNKILAGGRNNDSISFKKVEMKTLNDLIDSNKEHNPDK